MLWQAEPNAGAMLPVTFGFSIDLTLARQAAARYKTSLEALHTVALRMASTPELAEVLDSLAEASLQLLPAGAVHISVPEINIWLGENGETTGYYDVYHYIDMCREHYAKVGIGADFVDTLFR